MPRFNYITDINDPANDGPLKALDATGENSLFFPDNINDISHWVAFSIARYRFDTRDDFEKKEIEATIFLPMPSNLSTQYDQGYSSEGIGAAGIAGAKSGLFSSGSTGGAINSLIDSASSLSTDDIVGGLQYYTLQAAEDNLGGIVGAVVGGIPGAVAGAAAGQFLKGAIAGSGLARNPHQAVLYDGPNFRNHTFTFKLVARSKRESAAIRDIIYAFKYHQAPGFRDGNGHFFDYPEQFDIDFRYPDFLFNVAPSVLKSMEVNYHGEGDARYFDFAEDIKAPLSVILTLTFQETAIVTKGTIDQWNR